MHQIRSPGPLAGFKGPTSKGRGGEGKGGERRGRKGEGRGGKEVLVRASGIFTKIHQQIRQVLVIKTPIFSHTKGPRRKPP